MRAALLVLLGLYCAGAETPDAALQRLKQQAEAALNNQNYVESVHACAAAVRLAPADSGAQACAAKLEKPAATVATAGNALLGAGQFEQALSLCGDALVVAPQNAVASTCTTSASLNLVKHQADELKLAQARSALAAKNTQQAAPLLTSLASSQFPDILAQAIPLQRKLDLLSTSSSPYWTVFKESLRASWIMQAMAALALVAGLWIVLHWLRDGWRWLDRSTRNWRKHTGWSFKGMGDDKLFASDPVRDALRRVPIEVKEPVWTPARLMLDHNGSSWEVWEDSTAGDETCQRLEPIHEEVFHALWREDSDKTLADAFQNLQITTSPVGIPSIAKFWTGLVEWWHQGEPSFSGAAQEVASSDARKEVAIRLTSSGSEHGTLSVLASTPSEGGLDAVSLSAERAAYKLLFRLADEERPEKNGGKSQEEITEATKAEDNADQAKARMEEKDPKKDTAEQIDAHAAFRQGATALSRCLRLVADVDTAKQARDATLTKVVNNLEFARQVFVRAANHRVYYLATLRYEALAYALMDREAAALVRQEELQDTTSGSLREPERQIYLECLYNQAVLRWKLVTSAANQQAPFDLRVASRLFASVFAALNEKQGLLADAVKVWQLALMSCMTRSELKAIDDAQRRSNQSNALGLIHHLESAADNAAGAEQRHYALLASRARLYYAITQLRLIAIFDLPGRKPFASPVSEIPAEIAHRVAEAVDCFDKSDTLGPSREAAVTRAYAMLLLRNWDAAEAGARAAATGDSPDPFAVYVAAEACLQRGAEAAARQYLSAAQQLLNADAALSELAAALPPPQPNASVPGSKA